MFIYLEQKHEFDIFKDHSPLQYLKALWIKLRSLLFSFFHEKFPFESILECSKQFNYLSRK